MCIYDIGKKLKLNEIAMNETIEYMKWISADSIVVITVSSVYHLPSALERSTPMKMFDRDVMLKKCRIINYHVGEEHTTMIGTTAVNGCVSGNIQLFSLRKKETMRVQGHAGCFFDIKIKGNVYMSNLFCYVKRSGESLKLSIIQTTRAAGGDKRFKQQEAHIPFWSSVDTIEFPLGVHFDHSSQNLFVVSTCGHVLLYSLKNQSFTCSSRFSKHHILQTVACASEKGIFMLDSVGDLYSAKFNEVEMSSQRKMENFFGNKSNGGEYDGRFLNFGNEIERKRKSTSSSDIPLKKVIKAVSDNGTTGDSQEAEEIVLVSDKENDESNNSRGIPEGMEIFCYVNNCGYF